MTHLLSPPQKQLMKIVKYKGFLLFFVGQSTISTSKKSLLSATTGGKLMVSKNNLKLRKQQGTKQVPHYGLRKLSVGVASVLLSTTLYGALTAQADTSQNIPTNVTSVESATPAPSTGDTTNVASTTSTATPVKNTTSEATDGQNNQGALNGDKNANLAPVIGPSANSTPEKVGGGS